MEDTETLLIHDAAGENITDRNEHIEESHRINFKAVYRNKYLILASILATNGGILFGYDLGVVSGALLQVKDMFNLSCFQQEMVISSMIIGALVTSLFAGYLIDILGRKISIIISALMYVLGAIIISCSNSYAVLIVGRILLGSAMSLSSSSECVYVSEISPPSLRGTLLSFNEFGITLGFLLAYCSNVAFAAEMDNGWRWMFGLSALFALVVVITALLLPCSPRFLLTQNRADDAQKIWAELRQLDLSEEYGNKYHMEWAAMKAHGLPKSDTGSAGWCKIHWNNSTLYSFFVGLSLVLMQQCTGQPNLLFYASTVLISFGFKSNRAASLASVGLGLAKMISSIICILLIDKYNRKRFLVVGCLMISVSLLVVSICVLSYNIGVVESCNNLTVQFNHSVNDLGTSHKVNAEGIRWLVLFALLTFVTGYSLSFGPITWIILGEIFPTSIRGKAYSFTTSLNWATNLIISLTFLDISKATGSVGWPFLVNSILGFMSVAFIHVFVPETRGKSLEEIQETLKTKGNKYCCLTQT